MACVTTKGSCHVYDLKTSEGKTVAEHKIRIPAHKRYALKCKFSPDSSMLATSSADQTTKIWRTADYSLITVALKSLCFETTCSRRLFSRISTSRTSSGYGTSRSPRTLST